MNHKSTQTSRPHLFQFIRYILPCHTIQQWGIVEMTMCNLVRWGACDMYKVVDIRARLWSILRVNIQQGVKEL